MIKAFFASKEWARWAYGIGATLFGLLLVQVYIDVQFNTWYKEFYNIMQTAAPGQGATLEQFWSCLWKFGFLAMPYVWIWTFTNWLTKMYALRWREAITFNYLPRWDGIDVQIEGASQRIQQDTERFARIVETLGLAIVRAIMTLVAFIPILWGLSSMVDLPYLRDIPGSLMWLALVISIGGMIISWFVGWFLPGLEFNNQKVEAAYRKQLVKAEDDLDVRADMPSFFSLFTGVRKNSQRLYMHYGYFDLWAISYRQILTLLPYIIMGPGLFTGLILLGVLVQVSNAFGQVQSSFSLFIDRWRTITELRSIWRRLHQFEAMLEGKTPKMDLLSKVAAKVKED